MFTFLFTDNFKLGLPVGLGPPSGTSSGSWSSSGLPVVFPHDLPVGLDLTVYHCLPVGLGLRVGLGLEPLVGLASQFNSSTRLSGHKLELECPWF